MIVLAIDTASPAPAVALADETSVFVEPLPSDRTASEDLLPSIERVLAAGGRTLASCQRIAVCSGPGSFTGLRVGLATAWGLARALGCAVESVSTLSAMAEAARPEIGESGKPEARMSRPFGRSLSRSMRAAAKSLRLSMPFRPIELAR